MEAPSPTPQPSARVPALRGLRDVLVGPFRDPPSVWKLPAGADGLPPDEPLPWSENGVEGDGLAPGVPRPQDIPPHGVRYPKRNLVIIGQYLAEYGRWRGVLAVVLLLGAIHLPMLLVAPEGVDLTVGEAPYFLSPLGAAHKTVVHVAAGVGLLAALLLPMWMRGASLLVLGLTPIVLYFVIVQAGVADVGQGHGLMVFRDHIIALQPLWIVLSAGLVALQSFPDDARIRGVVVAAASLLFFWQFFLWGSLWTHPICAVTGGLVIVLAVAAIGVALRRSQMATIRLVRLGWLYVLALPVLYYLYLYELPEMAAAGPAARFLAFHGLVYAVATFAIATVGLVDLLHAMAWRREVKNAIGRDWVGVDPSSIEFTRRFLAFATDCGRFSSAEITFLQRALLDPRQPPPTN